MLYYAIKVLLSAVLVVVVSEVAKRSSLFGALIASLPLTSILAMVWLYLDTGDSAKVGSLASDILWLIIPSLLFFVALPVLLRHGIPFGWSLTLSIVATAVAYGLTTLIMEKFTNS